MIRTLVLTIALVVAVVFASGMFFSAEVATTVLATINGLISSLSGCVYFERTGVATPNAINRHQISPARQHYPALVGVGGLAGMLFACGVLSLWIACVTSSITILFAVPFLHNLFTGSYRRELWEI